MVYRAEHRNDKAKADLLEAIRLAPKSNAGYTSLAWMLATSPDAKVRDGVKAVEYGQKACEITGYKDANDLENLAAAHAEAGQFEAAVKWQQKAIALAEPSYSDHSLNKAKERLALFKAKKPYRDLTEHEFIERKPGTRPEPANYEVDRIEDVIVPPPVKKDEPKK